MKRSKLFMMPLIAFLAILFGISGYTASTAEAAPNFASIDAAGTGGIRNCDCSQDLYDCSDFASQDDAQACYWNCGAQNKGDIHKLDSDVNMVACDVEAIQPPSQPNSPPSRPSTSSQSLRNCDCSQDLYDCSDFASLDDAQACYWNCGAQGRGDIHKLDLDVNMVVCDVEDTQSPVQSGSTSASSTHSHSGTTHSHTDTTTHSHSGDRLASNYLGAYSINDTGFGTQVSVTVDEQAQTRTIVSNALPNHAVGEFPNPGNPNVISAQSKSWTLTTDPTFIGTASPIRETGVAVNGVKFEPGTAERATCETGETHRIEAIQDITSLGLDFNNAHVQPTGEYHYHGVSNMLVDIFSSSQDLVHVGFANDGHLIYYAKSGAYRASYRLGTGEREGTNCVYNGGPPDNRVYVEFGSYKDGSLTSDWDYVAGSGQLDECNGVTIDGQYLYLITNEYPYVPRCLMGEVTGGGAPGGGGPPGDGAGPGAGGGQGGSPPGSGPGGPPNFAAAAAQLGISEQALRDAIGGPPPDFERATAMLGITVEELQNALGRPPR